MSTLHWRWRALAGVAIMALPLAAAGQQVSVAGTWYDQDKYHLPGEPQGGPSWEVNFGSLSDFIANGSRYPPGTPVDEQDGPLKVQYLDSSCWIASAANMVATRTGVNPYNSWAYADGVNGHISYISGGGNDANLSFADFGFAHYALETAGLPWAVMAQGSVAFHWQDPADYIAASIRAGEPVNISFFWNLGEGLSGGHALTVYAIDTQAHTMTVADSDRDANTYSTYSYVLSGSGSAQTMTFTYAGFPGYSAPANAPLTGTVQYICTFDDVGWFTAGDGSWEDANNWASLHAPASGQDVYMTQSNVGLVTLATTAQVRSLTLSASASLELDNGAHLSVEQGISNAGTITHHAGASLQLGTGTFENLTGATYDLQGNLSAGWLQNAGTLQMSGGSATFNTLTNTGTLTMSGGNLAAAILQNVGTFQMSGGRTATLGSVTGSGSFAVTSQAILRLGSFWGSSLYIGGSSPGGLGLTDPSLTDHAPPLVLALADVAAPDNSSGDANPGSGLRTPLDGSGVPEPSAFWLVFMSLAAVAGHGRRKRGR